MLGLPAIFPIELPRNRDANRPYQSTQERQPIFPPGLKLRFNSKATGKKGFKRHIQYPIDGGYVEVCQKYNGFQEA